MESNIGIKLDFLIDTLDESYKAVDKALVDITTSITKINNELSNINIKVGNLEKAAFNQKNANYTLNEKIDLQMGIITSSNQILSTQIEIANMEVIVLREAMEASIMEIQDRIQKVDDKIPTRL